MQAKQGGTLLNGIILSTYRRVNSLRGNHERLERGRSKTPFTMESVLGTTGTAMTICQVRINPPLPPGC